MANASIPSKTIKPSPSWTNPRKRPHNPDPASLFEPIADDDALRVEDDVKALHAPKRIRAAEWPLKNTDDVSGTGLQEEEADGHDEKRSSTASVRPSKFQEGSMNDKVSQRPPSLYTKEEEAMENYVKSQGMDHHEMDVTYDTGIEPMKPSGMFRFGKVIASTFNPAHIWQGINGMWKEKEKENKVVPEKNVLQERQAKAIEAYAELKKNGYKGTKMGTIDRENQGIPAIKCQDAENAPRDSFRDSGIDVDGYPSSPDQTSSTPMMDINEALKVPPLTTANGRSASPFSNASSRRKSSLHFRKPSFQNLKKVKSQIHLPSIKKHTEASFSPSIETDDAATPMTAGLGLRRQPSKKDISRQTKLSKKVSDLENKLQIARHELESSISNAPPVPDLPAYLGRKPFVPGGLSSLPSERNMTPQQIKDNGGLALAEHRQTANRGRAASERLLEEPQPTSSIKRRGVHDTSNGNAHNASTEIDGVPEFQVPKGSASQTKVARPRKSHEPKKRSSHSPAEIKKRQVSKLPSKTPQNSPLTNNENLPPVPASIPTFDPLMVDQARMINMRTISSKALFGALAEDLSNLRKEFPIATEHDLAEYLRSLGWQPKVAKTTDVLSVAHDNRPASPFLRRPSASPMRTRSKNLKRGISPPPPSLSSAKKLRFDPCAKDTPTRGDSLKYKAPQKKPGRSVEATKYHKDKPLPDIQKEDYEWDEDVF